jgi:hypothetical protein
VTNTLDDGPGSLRNALVFANNGDTINITAKGTNTLTSGELVVAKSVIVQGPGAAKLSVSGNSASRVLHVTPNTIVTIFGQTIFVADAHRGDGKRFIVRVDEKADRVCGT